MTSSKEHTTKRLGRGSDWQSRPAWVIRSQILIQENVGPMLEKSQEYPESYYKVGPHEWQDVDYGTGCVLRVVLCCEGNWNVT